MATAYIYADADFSQVSPWPLAGTWYDLIDDPFGVYDDDTTYISNPGGATSTAYEFDLEPTSAYPVGSISDVLMTTRQRRELVINPFSRLRVGGSPYWAMSTSSVPYLEQTTNAAVSPKTGLDWTTPELDACRFNVTITSAGAGEYARVTALNLTVTYTPVAGMYTYLVSTWLPPLIASGLAGANICMKELQQMLWLMRGKKMKSQPSTPGEMRLLLESFKGRTAYGY